MNKNQYLEYAEKAIKQISGAGAFLIAQAGDKVNTMTIGWATIGFMWGRPIMTVAVRNSRYTHKIIEKASDFSVGIPADGMNAELEFCGSRSGRDSDKFKECNLELFPAKRIHTPIIRMAGIQYECKIVFKTHMDPVNLIKEYHSLYPNKDYHTLYFGEIVECYAAGI